MPNVTDADATRGYNELLGKFSEFIHLKKQVEDLTRLRDDLKTELAQIVEAEGEEDDKGHVWLELPEPVEGYIAMQRQKRISQKLDEQAAEELLREKKLYDRCYQMMPVLVEDEVMACLYEGLLSEEEIDTMFPKNITWAFVPAKKM